MEFDTITSYNQYMVNNNLTYWGCLNKKGGIKNEKSQNCIAWSW